MSRKIAVMAFAVILIICALQGACFAQDNSVESAGESLAVAAEEILAVIKDGNAADAKALFTEEAAATITEETFQQMADYFQGEVLHTEVADISVDTTNDLGTGSQITQRSASLQVVTDADEYYIQIQQERVNDGNWKINAFNIVSAADYSAATTVDEAKTAAPQGIMIAVTIAFYAVIVWASISCIRAKIKLKWLWMIIIILFTIAVAIAGDGYATNINVQFGFYIATFSSAFFLVNGVYQVCAVLPAGAILFLALKGVLERYYIRREWQQKIEMQAATAMTGSQDPEIPEKKNNQSEGLR